MSHGCAKNNDSSFYGTATLSPLACPRMSSYIMESQDTSIYTTPSQNKVQIGLKYAIKNGVCARRPKELANQNPVILGCTVEARKLEYDCPPTPKPREEGKPA